MSTADNLTVRLTDVVRQCARRWKVSSDRASRRLIGVLEHRKASGLGAESLANVVWHYPISDSEPDFNHVRLTIDDLIAFFLHPTPDRRIGQHHISSRLTVGEHLKEPVQGYLATDLVISISWLGGILREDGAPVPASWKAAADKTDKLA